MDEYCRYLKSDVYKLRRSWFFVIHLLFPVFGAALMLIYSRLSSSSELNKLAAFTQIIAIAFPFVISVVCQIVVSTSSNRAWHWTLVCDSLWSWGALCRKCLDIPI